MFDRPSKIWIVDVTSDNFERVMDLIRRYKFSFDDTVAQYFVEASNAKGQPSKIEVVDDKLVIDVKDDDLLNTWLNAIKVLEN